MEVNKGPLQSSKLALYKSVWRMLDKSPDDKSLVFVHFIGPSLKKKNNHILFMTHWKLNITTIRMSFVRRG